MSEIEIFIKNFFDEVEKLYNAVPGVEDGFGVDFLKIKRNADELKNDPSFSCKAGQSDENRKKNRYKDILPFDHTRVKLTGNNKSDYINASYIRRGTNEQCYIAAQGPLPHTVIDFWTMIWCCKVKVILMVCKEIEVGRRKCEKYWADENDNCKNFGEFQIQFKSKSQNCKDFVIRSLQVTYRNESRLITQLHYTTWPDHGIPKSRGSILQMLSAARSLQPYQCDKLQPLCIHCSAGCGRTGAVLAIDHFRYLIAIKRLEGSVFDVVTEMRKQRSSMVQTKDQYELVHLAVSEMLSMFGKDPDLFQDQKPRPPTTNNYVNVQIPAVDNKPRTSLIAPLKPSRSGQSRSSLTSTYDNRPLSTINKIPPPKPVLARRTSDTSSLALNSPHKRLDSGQMDPPAVTSSPTSSASIKERYNLKPVANSKKTSTSSMTSQANRFNSVSTLDLREKQSKVPASSLSIHDLTKVEAMTSHFNQSFKRNGVDTSSTIEEKKQATKQEPVVKKPLTSSAEKKSGFAYSNGVYTEVVVGAPPTIKPKPSIRKKETKKEPLKISDANNRVSDQQNPSRVSLKSLLHSNKATPAKLSPPKPARRSQLITNPQPAVRSSLHSTTDTDVKLKPTADYKTGPNQPPPVKPKRSSRPATTKQPPVVTKQPPVVTKQPPTTTRLPEAKRRIHSKLSESRGNIYSKVDDGHHANHQPPVHNPSQPLYTQLNINESTAKRTGLGPQQRTTTKLPEVEEVAPKIPERTPESYQVDDGYHDNQYESISVAKQQQQQPSVASGDNTYATISEIPTSNQQASLGSTVKARALGLLEKTTTAFQFTTSSASKTPTSESVGNKSSGVGEAYVQEPFIYSEQDLSYNNRYQRKPYGGRKVPEKWTSSGIL